jgi:spore germination protein KC
MKQIKNLTKKAAVAAVLIIVMVFSGCSKLTIYSGYKEPDNIIVIRTLGIDYENGKISVTGCTGVGLEGTAPMIFTAEGASLAEAVAGMTKGYMRQEPIFSHTEHILIGSKAAERGIGSFLDYVARDVDMRLSTNIFILKDGTAKDAITKCAGEPTSTADMLTAIKSEAPEVGEGYVYTCEEVMSALAGKGCAIIQAVSIKDSPELSAEAKKEGEEVKSVEPDGFAIIREGFPTSYTNETQTAGILYLTGKLKSAMLSVQDSEGNNVTLMVTGEETEFKPLERDGETVGADITCSLSLSVEEAGGAVQLYNAQERENLENRCGEIVLSQVMSAIELSRAINIDFCSIGKRVERNSPYLFREIGDRWEEDFSELDMHISVRSKIERTYDIGDNINLTGDGNTSGAE